MMTFPPPCTLQLRNLFTYLELYVFDASVIRCTSLTPGYE